MSNLPHQRPISHPHRVHPFSFVILSPSTSLTPHRVRGFWPSIRLSLRYPPIRERTMGGGISWCWHARTYAASEARRTRFYRAIHLTPSAFEHCRIAAGFRESESPCPQRGHFRDGGAFALTRTVAGALPATPPSAPPRLRWPRPPAIRVSLILLANRGRSSR